MKNNRGFTLIEMVLAVALMGVMMSSLSWTTNQYVGTVKRESTAQYMGKWLRAADQYIKDNSAALAITATPTVPATVTTANLVAANLLDAATASTNPYGQTVCAKVLEPSANVLNALVVTNGGTAIDDIDVGEIASRMGANGGYIKTGTPTTAQGAYGGWSVSTANYNDCSGVATTAGHLTGALFFNNTKVLGDYLYRNDVAGHPEATTMGATLNMGSQNITAAGSYSGASSTLTGNAAVGGTLGVTGVSTMAGLSNSGTLTQAGNASMGGTLGVAGATTMAGLSNSGTLTQAGNASMGGTLGVAGATTMAGMSATSINNSGTLTQTGLATMAGGASITGGNLQMNGLNIAGVGTLTATTGNITTVNATNVNASNQVQMAQGYMTGTAVLAGACTPNGILRQDGAGLLLSCQGLVWAKATGASGGGGGGTVGSIGGNSVHGFVEYSCGGGVVAVPAGVNVVIFNAYGGGGGKESSASEVGGGGGGAASAYDNTLGWLFYLGGGGGGGGTAAIGGNGGAGGTFTAVARGGSSTAGWNGANGTWFNSGGAGGGAGGGVGGGVGSAGGNTTGWGGLSGASGNGGSGGLYGSGGGGGGWGGGGAGQNWVGGGGGGSSYLSTSLASANNLVSQGNVAGHSITLRAGCAGLGGFSGSSGYVSMLW